MKPKVFIDGQAGTTGLQIYDRLSQRADITLLTIPEEKRKDLATKKALMNEADLVFLCLPDAAAVESVALIENPNTKVVDASTAHRTNPHWTYGFPELHGQREAIIKASRVANPGCHASGFIAIVRPLVELGLLPKDALLTAFSLTGYTGGGKAMIADYEAVDANPLFMGGKEYALTQSHKHLPEMVALCGLETSPVFTPIVVPTPQGMATTVSFHGSQLKTGKTLEQLTLCYQDYYKDGLVQVAKSIPDALYPSMAANTDGMTIVVAGKENAFTVTALFDNLGKGASGSAVQNMNLMLGLGELTGLTPNKKGC